MVKGFKKDGKFRPTEKKRKSISSHHLKGHEVPSSIGNQELIRRKRSFEGMKPLPKEGTKEYREIEDEVRRRADRDFNEVRLENLQKIAPDTWFDFIETVEPKMSDVKDHFGESTLSDKEFNSNHSEDEIEDAKQELRDEQREIMWGTIFEAKDSMLADRIRENKEVIINDIGFRVIDLGDSEESEAYGQGVFLGVNGAGYDFYEAHWIPLYRLFGWV